jgi:solute carrier family 25 phosphate transporter 23/24/25/41
MQKEKKASAFLSNFEHLLSGGIAGALSRTFTSPIERIIILRQTQNVKYVDTSLVNILIKMYKTEGILSYFKGNGVNCLRISPF